MFLYIFADVLEDYTSGMAVIATESHDEAVKIAFKELGVRSMEDFFKYSPEFKPAEAVYRVEDNIEVGVKHYVHGGG